MSKVIIVDDTDPAISYSGNWATLSSVGVNTNEYNSSVHYSSASGDELSYDFYGTSIIVYGTLDAPSVYGPPNASFSIDGLTATPFNSSQTVFVDSPNQMTAYVPLYQSVGLERKSHRLRIQTGTPANAAARLYIDFFTVITGSDSASGNIIVDDRDPSIQYTGSWGDAGVRWEYEQTTKQAPSDQAGGTARFLFNGTSITVFGTLQFSSGPGSTPSIGFEIDDVAMGSFTGGQNSPVIEHVPFFHAANLSDAQEHTIVMTSLTLNTWFLDFVVYEAPNSATAGGGDGGPVLGSTGTSPNQGKNVIPIVGGVVAAFVALLSIAGILFVVLRRRKLKVKEEANHQAPKEVATADQSALVDPFTLPGTGSHVQPHPSSSKRFNPGASYPGLVGRSGDTVGTSSAYSSSPPVTSRYSDGESQQEFRPSPMEQVPADYSLTHTSSLRFAPGAGRTVSVTHRDRQQGQGRAKRHPSGQKAQFVRSPAPAPVIALQPPPGISTSLIEEDSGIRIPQTSPPVYTPD